MDFNALTEKIIGLAIQVHRTLGPGLLESAYEEDQIILELKSVKELDDHAYKQLLTYLRLSGRKLGLIINFNEGLLKNGIKRVINGERDSSPLCESL